MTRLVYPSGHPSLDSLQDVRMVRDDEDGLLLHGPVLSVRSGVTSKIPQAWLVRRDQRGRRGRLSQRSRGLLRQLLDFLAAVPLGPHRLSHGRLRLSGLLTS